jgi:hypothetical protein
MEGSCECSFLERKMQLRAKVRYLTGQTKHYVAAVQDGEPVPVAELGPPSFVEICPEDAGFLLFRLDAFGARLADTWHSTIADAKRQAQFEFNIEDEEWQVVDN